MFTIKIETGNAAFCDPNCEYDNYYRGHETARILRSIADRVESGKTDGYCSDFNGNIVGEYSFEDK